MQPLQDADHPAVLKLIEETCRAAKEAGIWVGVRGRAAADPA
ncbi:MAG: putative PEP-binding protein, partial [Rubrobacter sp.]